jgi:hypothetical protein
VKKLDQTFFDNIDGYNRLLKSFEFYKKLQGFDYILIYQTDAYIFKNELDYWCSLCYDYIGAPWTGLHKWNNHPLTGVGNGGFSLRNIKSTIKVLYKLRMLEVLEQYQFFNWKGILPKLPHLIYRLIKARTEPGFAEREVVCQEDIFWCKYAPERLSTFAPINGIVRLIASLAIKNTFKIAPEKIAASFSFETNPSYLFRVNNENLPFGCHAWEKHEPEFWKTFIPLET